MRDLTIPRRITRRREAAGLAGYELAKRAGISPSYLSLIESGRKIPSEAVAMRLAEALGEDPDLYRAWVETADEHDLEARAARLQRMRRVRSGGRDPLPAAAAPGMREWQERRREPEGAAGVFTNAISALSAPFRRSRPPRPPEQPRTLRIPLLQDGVDPLHADRPGNVQGAIDLDASLLPGEPDVRRLFALHATRESVERIRDVAAPRDVLVLAAEPATIDAAAVYAVRHGGRILLTRIAYARPSLVLVGADSTQPPITITATDESAALRMLAGVVVTSIRAWPQPSRSSASPRPSLGRTGRLEDGHIVRDCEWKPDFGWRPVQKAEDMDYLIAHPEKTIRFRLLRDGQVHRVLEMNAEQWQQALGDYYEGSNWYRNGYIVAITRRKRGEYTEDFQDRWAPYIRPPHPSECV